MQITPLGFALIGLTKIEPRTGYALRMVFEETPLGAYSSSPGSIYPALARLIKAGLLIQHPLAGKKTALYAPTPLGTEAFLKWLNADVTVTDVANDVDSVMLRFAFHEAAGAGADTAVFLISYQRAVKAHLSALYAFMKSAEGKALSVHGRLAMDYGISSYENQLQWIGRATTALADEKNKGNGR